MGISIHSRRGIDIIIPFYRNAHLVGPLLESLRDICEELSELACTIVAINDSPDDPELLQVLSAAIDALSASVPCRLIVNERNLGFVRSVNAAALQAVASRRDVLLLNSDTVVFKDALREIHKVAWTDPMIAFVSPRSNNATICSMPQQEEFRHLEPKEAYAVFHQLCQYLPESHFVPTVVGFCMFIKFEVLEELGYFDEAYGLGYNEENDLIMRANRCGYRAALANHAYVYHAGRSSFETHPTCSPSLGAANTKLLEERYPEYAPSVNTYFSGPRSQAERLITGMLPDRKGRLDLVFDLSTVVPTHNGTHDTCRQILLRATKIWHQFNIYVMASAEVVRFHRLDEIEGVFFVSTATQRTFAVAFRFGQPFGYEPLFRMSRIAAINIYCMLDPIAYDCLHLRNDDLEAVWEAVFNHSDGVIYISDSAKALFHRRFQVRHDMHERVIYQSLDYRDYADQAVTASPRGDYLLVIGNAHAHKRVAATVNALSLAFPREKIVALGLLEDQRHNVIGYQSGYLTELQMEQLMRGARLVIFPSTYEGFGIPVVESLAYRKPILARNIPTNYILQQKLREHENLILYSSTDDLIRRLRLGYPVWMDRPGPPDLCPGWDAVTDEIGQFLFEISRAICFDRVLVPRLQHIQLLEEKVKLQVQVDAAKEQAAALVKQTQAAASALARSEELSAAVREKEAQIRDFYRSLSWRVTGPARRLADVYQRLTGKN